MLAAAVLTRIDGEPRFMIAEMTADTNGSTNAGISGSGLLARIRTQLRDAGARIGTLRDAVMTRDTSVDPQALASVADRAAQLAADIIGFGASIRNGEHKHANAARGVGFVLGVGHRHFTPSCATIRLPPRR